MLMPSQLPTPTTIIQTLPSDQKQQQHEQQEYIDTISNQKNSIAKKFRREKSMEFDNRTEHIYTLNDDINNNHSRSHSSDEIVGLESNNLSPESSLDGESHLIIPTSPSPEQILNPMHNIQRKQPEIFSNVRRPIRSATARRLNGENDQTMSTNVNEPDPNVYLISSDTNSHNTIRKTKHDVKRFVMYIEEQFGDQNLLHTIPAESLCRYLKHYFENTKKFDGTQYEPDTLRSFLLSIERYLKSKNYEHNLMESSIFQPCRQVIINKREQWKKMGGGNQSTNQQNKSSLALLNVKSLVISDRARPDGLLLEMFIHISKLCPDRVPSLGQLLWGDISLINEQYLVYNHQKAANQTIRINATPGQPALCPVQAYRLYATHRPPQTNTPQSPFFLVPRTSNTNHIWYKTTAAGKNLEQILQKAIERNSVPSQSSPISSVTNMKLSDHSTLSASKEISSSMSTLNGKRSEPRMVSPSLVPSAKRMHSSIFSLQPLNLSVVTMPHTSIEDDIGTMSYSPANSSSNDGLTGKNSSRITDLFTKPLPSSTTSPIWDESVTEILLTVAKQRDTRLVKINTLRTYLEEKLGVVEFLCLYRGFKSEPKITFHDTPWEHYQRFLPVLFTLLTLDNTTV